MKGKKKRKEKVSQRTHTYWSRRIFKRNSTGTVYHAFPVPRRRTILKIRSIKGSKVLCSIANKLLSTRQKFFLWWSLLTANYVTENDKFSWNVVQLGLQFLKAGTPIFYKQYNMEISFHTKYWTVELPAGINQVSFVFFSFLIFFFCVWYCFHLERFCIFSLTFFTKLYTKLLHSLFKYFFP